VRKKEERQKPQLQNIMACALLWAAITTKKFILNQNSFYYFLNEKSQFSSIMAPIHNLEQTKQQCLVKHIPPPYQTQILAQFPYHRAGGLQHVQIKSAVNINAKPSSRSAVLLTTDL